MSSPLEGIQLELGVTSIGTIMKARRINYLHYLLQTNENEMLNKVFRAQLSQPVKLDWVKQILQDLKDFQINMTFEDIKDKKL